MKLNQSYKKCWALVFPDGTLDPEHFYASKTELKQKSPPKFMANPIGWSDMLRQGFSIATISFNVTRVSKS